MDPLSNWYPFMMEFALGRECGVEHLPDVFRDPDNFTSVARSFLEIAMPAALDRYEDRDPEAILDAIRTEQPLMAAIATALVGHTRMQLGERDEAQRELSLLREGGFSEIPKIDLWLLVMGLAAELAAFLDDRESAEEIYALLGPFAHLSLRDPFQYLSLGPVSHFLGILAAVLERPEAAVRHFEVALEHSNRMQARAHLTRTQLEMARALASLGKQGPARTLRQTAQASARELGMTTLLG